METTFTYVPFSGPWVLASRLGCNSVVCRAVLCPSAVLKTKFALSHSFYVSLSTAHLWDSAFCPECPRRAGSGGFYENGKCYVVQCSRGFGEFPIPPKGLAVSRDREVASGEGSSLSVLPSGKGKGTLYSSLSLGVLEIEDKELLTPVGRWGPQGEKQCKNGNMAVSPPANQLNSGQCLVSFLP